MKKFYSIGTLMNKREWQEYRKVLKELHRHTKAVSTILDILFSGYSSRSGVAHHNKLWDALEALDHTIVRVNNVISEGRDQSEKGVEQSSNPEYVRQNSAN